MKIYSLIIHPKDQISSAALNRFYLIGNGLRSNGIDCEDIVIDPGSTSTYKRAVASVRFLILVIKTFLLARSKDVILLSGPFPFLSFFIRFKKSGVKLLAERTEYPTHVIKKLHPKSRQFKNSTLYCRSLHLFDGFITCSKSLTDYYSTYTKKSCKFLEIPLIIDYSLFQVSSSIETNYITYCGDFGQNKDGVPILIKAFKLLTSYHPDLKLKLIGGTVHTNDLQEIYALVDKLELKERVVFTGRVPHQDIPSLLNASKVLVLARPSNKQAEGGFPSKLAEYMSTGKPVLVTRVGDIDSYFIDRHDIFFSEPDDASKFAQKVDFILRNYEDACEVGEKGRISIKKFDYREQGANIINFFEL